MDTLKNTMNRIASIEHKSAEMDVNLKDYNPDIDKIETAYLASSKTIQDIVNMAKKEVENIKPYLGYAKDTKIMLDQDLTKLESALKNVADLPDIANPIKKQMKEYSAFISLLNQYIGGFETAMKAYGVISQAW